MSRQKQPLPKEFGDFNTLNKDIASQIAGHSPFRGMQSILCTNKANYELFKPCSKRALTYVTQGNLKALHWAINNNPEELFEKHHIIDPRGRIFYKVKVSAYQKIIFLCDADMKHQIIKLIPDTKEMKAQCKAQEEELGKGGADLIKLNKNPLSADFNFNEITEFKQTFTLYDNEQEITFPLLENQDGIIYFQDANKIVHFYYANLETKDIKLLNPSFTSEEDKQDFEAFKISFESMENNSGRRSSNNEHQLIAKTMQCTLIRQGIEYEQNGIVYRDSQSGFQLINAYRTCIRLYEEAELNGQWDKAHDYWRKGVGARQGEEMWLLERICEKDRTFYPLPKHFNNFNRDGFAFYYWAKAVDCAAFSDGELHSGLSSDFALYKVGGGWQVMAGAGVRAPALAGLRVDLIAVCRLVEDAKANIVEFKRGPEPDMLENCSLQ